MVKINYYIQPNNLSSALEIPYGTVHLIIKACNLTREFNSMTKCSLNLVED